MKQKYINVEGKLWNSNHSLVCNGRKKSTINCIPKQDAEIDVSYVLGAIFIYFMQGLITERR